ncbi:hypothetical protein F5Y15DRAFT_67342 [Xylariaceae sp. FL0016]|nr:hypothetical protein F5Y15DRAFT_67342 [Xylariaceae sp. FL0016]
MSGLDWSPAATLALFFLVIVYLFRVNQLLSRVPDEVRRLPGPPWTPARLRDTYEKLDREPIDYTDRLPPKLDRRYIVTGGSGLVGGFIVLQLLARGTPPAAIRVLDIRRSERPDMQRGSATKVDFVRTDITSKYSVDSAFSKTWDPSVAQLPLTVFHTAAVILASERSHHQYSFPESVNVHGTKLVLEAATDAGADIFSSTSSASIAIKPVGAFVWPWAREPRNFFQILDTRDFSEPLRKREGYFGNYPASKAAAERLVCAADGDAMRTGCIRPANGVYGNPTDNTVGDPLSRAVLPTWVPHIVQSFVHGANVAIAHLHHEAALVARPSSSGREGVAKVSGRPFVVTDPNPPIRYRDLYACIRSLSVHPFTTVRVPPALVLLLAHAAELYAELQHRAPSWLPPLRGDIRHLKPGIFSICTHLVGTNAEISRPVSEGGLGYEGALTTLQGMTLELLEWNREHAAHGDDNRKRKAYTTSVSLAEKIRELGAIGKVASG